MRLFSYVVAFDYGFAPNPFFGFCTLATCKPQIRARAEVGDWVVGTGGQGRYKLAGFLIYAMQVDEILDFNAYWSDARFACKRPILNGSLKVMYGDNIYHSGRNGWVQADSHHSLVAGRPNRGNLERDTKTTRVLISQKFVYFGAAAQPIPDEFRLFGSRQEDLCCPARAHRSRFSTEIITTFADWLEANGQWGVRGFPLEFGKHKRVVKTAVRADDSSHP